MGKTRSLYFRDDTEYEVTKACLEICRFGLSKEQLNVIMDIVGKAKDKLAASTKISIEELILAMARSGLSNDEIKRYIEGGVVDKYRARTKMVFGDGDGGFIEGPGGMIVFPDGSGDIDEYRAACKEQGIELKID